jgi:DNA-binding beta-propeller fold protein YncE
VLDGRTLDEPADPVYPTEEVAVSSDGGFAVAADEGEQTIDVWDLRARRRIRSLHGHPVRVKAIRADASFTIVTGDHHGNVRICGLDWDYEE